jgi:hypothetical protein
MVYNIPTRADFSSGRKNPLPLAADFHFSHFSDTWQLVINIRPG